MTRRRGDAETRRQPKKPARPSKSTVPASPRPRVPASTPVPAPALTPSQQAQRDVGFEALKKQMNGEKLSAAEIGALRKYEKQTGRAKLQAAYQRCSGEDLRGLIGSSRQQLVRYVGYGMPRNEDGSYNLAMALPWLLEHERARVRKEGEKAVDALEVQRRIKAQRMELDLAEKREQVYPVDRFKQWIWDYFHGVSSRLQSWPRVVARTREEELRMSEEMKKLLKSFDDELAGITGGRRQPARVPARHTEGGQASPRRRPPHGGRASVPASAPKASRP